VRVERAATRSAGAPSNMIRPESLPAPGAEVDDPIGIRHDRPVVLDNDDRLASNGEDSRRILVIRMSVWFLVASIEHSRLLRGAAKSDG
jgi:hypothetical protein